MITINAKVIGENIQLMDSPLVASKSVQSVRILFDFDDAWDGFGRIALFWGVDDEVYTSQIINGATIVPHEAMAESGKIKFGVYGTNGSKRIVSVKMTYKIVEGAYTSVATESVEPSASLLDQIEAGIGTMEDYAKEIRQTSKAAVEIAQDANTRSVIALEKASTAESDSATMATDIDELKKGVRKYELESGSFFGGAFLDEDTNTLYFTDKSGHVIAEIENIGRGGGGGGGGGDSTSRISMTNTSGWQSKTLAQNTDGTIPSCPVTFVWSSLENDMPTGNGSLRITINGSSAAMLEVGQGQVTIDMAQYLKAGTSLVDFTVYDIYGKSRNIRFTVDVIEMYIESPFDSTQSYRGAFPFAYTPHGAVRKTVYFEMDGQSIGEVSTATNGHQQSFTVPQQSHGSHVLRVWFTADINGQTVSSNVLYYEIICIDPLNNLPIIVSNFDRTTVQQYETLEIKYNVYDPLNMVTPVVIEVNGAHAAALNADRQTQTFTWRVSKAEPLTIAIKAGSGSNVSTKTIALQVTESDVHPEAVTDQLSLHLDAVGRSNSEANPAVWEYGQGTGKVSATFTGFNWARDGWQQDESGLSCLRVLGGAKVTVPFKPYAQDFRGSGKAIELEFQSHNVLDYERPIISCMSGNRGFEVYADHAVFKSARAEINCRFATERPTRLTLVVQPQSEHRLTYLYIDGVYQSIAQYSTTDSFQQANPVGITIGDASCGVDIYNIRVYDRELTPEEVLGNYIADRQDAFDMLKLYRRNDIFDNGSITISKLPKELPYVILSGPESPQYKGDKKTVSMVYEEPINDANSRHLTATGVVVNVQGTSSQYYAVKNLKITFKDGATVNGKLVIGFTIRDGSIMVDTFTLKADVASSESANNILLAILFDDLSRELGIKTPPQQTNAAIRQGMDGFPCAVFWDFGDGPVFVGKYNFNNDKGTPEVFGFTEGDEIWDVRNFDSLLSKFRTNVFGDNWTNDYESIYPEDYFDTTRLQAMTDFIYGTWQENASGDALDSPVTYDGVTYTNDTAAYRLAKFKAEYGNWYDLDNAAFFYVFTLVMSLVDNRQKNEHLAFWHSISKWWELPYDFDSALGTDNLGRLAFEYWLEDIDLVGGKQVYNGQDNVKWQNFRQTFWDRCCAMYQRMRSTGHFSAAYIERLFTAWQTAWPEAMWNEDGDYKYVAPVRKDNDTTYLSMALGDKHGQRADFLKWRFAYCDSLFDAGDAMKTIMFRPYFHITEAQRASGDYDVTVELYKKGYVKLLWDDYAVGDRVVGDSLVYQCENPYTDANQAVCNLHNAGNIKDIFGLEKLNVQYFHSSDAENLQAVRLGSQATGYRNEMTVEVSVGANKKLTLVEMTGCVNFGTENQKVLDLAHCPNLKEVYMGGTACQGVDLPDGGILETLVLPATTSSLVIRNQLRLTDSGLTLESWTNIDQLWLENMSGLDSKAIFNRVPVGTAIRITGFRWEAADAAEIDAIMDRLDTMRGIDINGQGQSMEVDDAQMSGTIHASALRGDDITRWKSRYPTITITADHTSSTKIFKSYDGSTTIGTVEYADGHPTAALPTVPARTQTAQHTFAAVGWNTAQDAQVANFDASTVDDSDLTLYAAYSRTVRSYPITFDPANGSNSKTTNYQYGAIPSWGEAMPTKDGQTATGWSPEIVPVTGPATYTAVYKPVWTATFVLAAEDNGGTARTLKTQSVIDGNTPTPPTETPTSSRGNDYTFAGWSPSVGPIHANTTYTAVFDAPSQGTITDSWEQIIAAGIDGTYASKYNIGDTKDLNLGTEGTVLMVLVAKNVDPLASGNGNAPMTWISQELLKTTHRWNPSASGTTEGTGTYGGWEKSELRTYLRETIMPLIPEAVRNAIKPVTKYSRIYNTADSAENNVASTETVWIPSRHEMFDGTGEYYESQGPRYSTAFPDNASRIKKNVSTGSAAWWWLRSATGNSGANTVNGGGSYNYYDVNVSSGGVVRGFCL